MEKNAQLHSIQTETDIFYTPNRNYAIYDTEDAQKYVLKYSTLFEKRMSFENFKSTVCHRVKEVGEVNFIVENILARCVEVFYKKQWYLESFYTLAMLDYLSRKNNIPLCGIYNKMRCGKLEKLVYPSGIMRLYMASKDESILKESFERSIPEFKRFNIIENEVENLA